MIQLRDYQIETIDKIAQLYTLKYNRIVIQLPTGAGKTVTFSALINRFMGKIDGNIIVAVHRDKLLKQTQKTLYKLGKIEAQAIIQGVTHRNPNFRVYITMVETAIRRLNKNPKFFGDAKLLIIDECHIGNFKKLLPKFGDSTLIVGCTATPISSTKKDPLKNYYQEIITGPQISHFIEQGNLCQNYTYHIKGMNRKDLSLDNKGEFAMGAMGAEYSKPKYINNVVTAYKQKSDGEKAIVFNCNVAHSKAVTEAFIMAGYDARHFDGTSDDAERNKIYEWFAKTPGAILCNVDLTTAGFDEPTIQTVITNYSTTSLTRWLQSTGRGSRPIPGIKSTFKILDMGGNALAHGDWSDDFNWKRIFHEPPKPGKGDGVAPIKICVNDQCECIIPASANVCKMCGTIQPTKAKIEPEQIELELFTKGIDVKNVVDIASERKYEIHYSLHAIKSKLITNLASHTKVATDEQAQKILDLYQVSVKEWCGMNGKKYNEFYKGLTRGWMLQELERHFGWTPQEITINL